MKRDGGQIAIVLVFIVLGMAFLLLLAFDIFLGARGKMRLQNAGDAAALAAAGWQRNTLNLIGELNLVRCEGPGEEVAAGISAMQERLAFAGPMIGFLHANLAARENGAPPMPELSAMVEAQIASALERLSPTSTWETKPEDYAEMVRAVLRSSPQGLHAGCDNARFFTRNPMGAHILYRRDFYTAADGENWVWFCRYFGWNHRRAIEELFGFGGDWGEIPPPDECSPLDPEYFGTGLVSCRVDMTNDVCETAAEKLAAAAAACGHGNVTAESLEENGVTGYSNAPWWFLDTSVWRPWTEIDPDGHDRFPLLGHVKREYDLLGASAACLAKRRMVPVSDAARTNTFVWTAAAKPFGKLDFQAPGSRVVDLFAVFENQEFPRDAPLVLPVFSFSRLIPLGGVGELNLGRADPEWTRHCCDHVPNGMGADGCRYCAAAARFAASAREGAKWLMAHDHDEVCAPPGEGPERGGTRHGH